MTAPVREVTVANEQRIAKEKNIVMTTIKNKTTMTNYKDYKIGQDIRTKQDRMGKYSDFQFALVIMIVINAVLMISNIYLMQKISTLLKVVII